MPISFHSKIAIGWAAAIGFGLYSFYLSKNYIEAHRYEAMKARERIAKFTDDPTNLTRVMSKESSEPDNLDKILETLESKVQAALKKVNKVSDE